MLTRLLSALLLLPFLLTPVHATPFWGDTTSQPVETDPARLQSGQFIWKGDAIPSGPILVVVSLPEQRAYVYRNGVRIGVSSASTGKAGHNTPTGVFTVLQKDKSHLSKTYNNAPMPYTERLTWDGVALHAGALPGYPSSHGCVHLPSEFARLLFEASPMGMTVVVANEHRMPNEVVHPAAISPVEASKGKPMKVPRLSTKEMFRWQPENALEGPISIVMSAKDQRVLVFRNGIEIGRSRFALRQNKRALGTHAFIMQSGWSEGHGLLKDAPAHRWLAVGIPGHAGEDKHLLNPAEIDRINLPLQFAKLVYDILEPGTTLLVTDAPILDQKTTGVALNIINADQPTLD